jgi:hypothetical protein
MIYSFCMETVTAEVKVSSDGRLEFAAPETFKGATAILTLTKKEPAAAAEKRGWPLGFWESVYGSIQDENFKRWPQGEMDPAPSFE